MLSRYTLLWLVLPVIGTLNGMLREFIYKKFLTDLPAHQLSTLSGIIFFGIFIWIINQKWPLNSSKQAFRVGCIWLLLTVLFEFGFGHYVFGQPWSALLHDYNILAGRLWILILLWISIAPWLFYRINIKNKQLHQTIANPESA